MKQLPQIETYRWISRSYRLGDIEAANRTRQAATSGLLGNPELSSSVENQGLGYQAGEYARSNCTSTTKVLWTRIISF